MALPAIITTRRPATMQERLERALVTAAELVTLHGDDYVPFFERIEEELHLLRLRSSAGDRARQMAARMAPRGAAQIGR